MKSFLLAAYAASTSICTPDSSICVYSVVKDANTVCFTVHSTFPGWTGFGMGTSMMDKSDMYIAWPSNATVVNLANLKSSGHVVTPSLVNNGNIVPLDPTFKPVNNPVSKYTFCRPITILGVSLTETSNYIYAGSTSKPLGNSTSTLKLTSTLHLTIEHDFGTYGTFRYNFLTAPNTTVSTVTTVTDGIHGILATSNTFSLADVINIHAACMWIAWTLSPIVGIFIARYAKTKLGHNWYILHMSVMGITTMSVGIVGLSFVLFYLPPPHFYSSHSILGITIMVVMVGQVALGFFSNHLFNPSRSNVLLVAKSHWWLGRSLVLMGIINCQLGFTLYAEIWPLSKYFMITHWVVVGLAAILFAWYEAKIGKSKHWDSVQQKDIYGSDRRIKLSY